MTGHDPGSLVGRAAHTCLPLVLPASASVFSVTDPALADLLAAEGSTVRAPGDGAASDAAIGPPFDGAPTAVALVATAREKVSGRGGLAVRRVVDHLRARREVAGAQRALAAAGYDDRRVIWWDLGQTVPWPSAASGVSHALKHRFPRRAIVVGRGTDEEHTVAMVVADRAEAVLDGPLRVESVLARSGLLVVLGEAAVVRMALGPSRVRIEAQATALEHLARLDPAPGVAGRVPWPLGGGRVGPVTWSVEQRCAGRPDDTLSERVLEQATDFLIALHRLGPAGRGPDLDGSAEVIAAACTRREEAAAVLDLAAQVSEAVADLPLGFGHGDFWHRNLLVESGSLSAVIDWDAAGPGHLPYLDLLHLRLNAARPRGALRWGNAVVDQALPAASRGGDPVDRRYCEAIGFEPDPAVLTSLVAGYWLHLVASKLVRYEERAARPVWMQSTVSGVLSELRRSLDR